MTSTTNGCCCWTNTCLYNERQRRKGEPRQAACKAGGQQHQTAASAVRNHARRVVIKFGNKVMQAHAAVARQHCSPCTAARHMCATQTQNTLNSEAPCMLMPHAACKHTCMRCTTRPTRLAPSSMHASCDDSVHGGRQTEASVPPTEAKHAVTPDSLQQRLLAVVHTQGRNNSDAQRTSRV